MFKGTLPQSNHNFRYADAQGNVLNLETMAESDAGAQNIHEVRLFSVSTVLQTKAVRNRILKSFRLKGHFHKFHKASGG